MIRDSWAAGERHGLITKDAAGYCPEPKPAAKNIAGYSAFWRGVKIEP